MTKEEAIKKINVIKKYLTAGNPIWDIKEIDVALNMAIEALQNEGIGRYEKAIQTLREMPRRLNDIKEKRIKKIPPKTEWILCNERLPKNEEWVIVTILDEYGDTPYRYTDFGWYLETANCWIIDAQKRTDVTAWMPLPESYKGGDIK